MEITSTIIQIVVNGEPREVPVELSIGALISKLGREPEMRGIAVAVNDRVVRRADWPEVVVQEGDRVEIITASQGG